MASKLDASELVRLSDNDTGSPEFQISILTAKINKLVGDHFSVHKKDHHSRYGLKIMISKRNKLLLYLKSKSYQRYVDITDKLKIRRKKENM